VRVRAGLCRVQNRVMVHRYGTSSFSYNVITKLNQPVLAVLVNFLIFTENSSQPNIIAVQE